MADNEALIKLHIENLNKEKAKNDKCKGEIKKLKGELKQVKTKLDKAGDNAIDMVEKNARDVVEEFKKKSRVVKVSQIL